MIVIFGLRRVGAVGVTVLALAAGLAGCGTIATNDSVEKQIASQLGTESTDCPDDLEGEVGRSIICKATRGDETFDVKVTVTSIDNGMINFDIERVDPPQETAVPASDVVEDVPSADPAATVEGRIVGQSVFDQLKSRRKEVDRVTCPDLQARVGASQRCTLVAGSRTYGVTVTVTSVRGTDVKFDIQVDETPQ